MSIDPDSWRMIKLWALITATAAAFDYSIAKDPDC
jgi:hypothetical protein